MLLDLSPLEKAISRLDESLALCGSGLAAGDPRVARTLQAGAVQAFEFTYELCWKMLRRYLAACEPSPSGLEELSFPDLIRLGCRRGLLLRDWAAWRRFRQDRSITSQTYDPDKAAAVFETLPAFLEEARFLLARLKERHSEP